MLLFSHVHHTYSRMYYSFIDNQLLPTARACNYQIIVISDHAPVVLSLMLHGFPQIKRHWRFNSTLLTDKDFVKFMEEQITFFCINTFPETSSLIVWDTFRTYIRGQIISYSVNMKKQVNKKRLDIIKHIKEIDRQYAQTKDPKVHKKRVELQTEFDLLSTHPVERQLLESKSLFYTHRDKSGKLLVS